MLIFIMLSKISCWLDRKRSRVTVRRGGGGWGLRADQWRHHMWPLQAKFRGRATPGGAQANAHLSADTMQLPSPQWRHRQQSRDRLAFPSDVIYSRLDLRIQLIDKRDLLWVVLHGRCRQFFSFIRYKYFWRTCVLLKSKYPSKQLPRKCREQYSWE